MFESHVKYQLLKSQYDKNPHCWIVLRITRLIISMKLKVENFKIGHIKTDRRDYDIEDLSCVFM